ncbi:PatB family C-S lyase [Aliiglaciecola sp. CAU 1673]|uniref:MalY/PatB family protein n=1 Tax=Aliiglaciecola sp. CAU 1673 TaxID=3032595 RepID=UPI0023DB0652|nr:PatB family C-S lyase [Aliiglaciecola sp. CAU 1673]MDF2177772.1 PatB family C-S lyase [Aliiglaciecola sp. CAU 1673]
MDFNELIDRSQTYAFKWEKYRDQDVLPMWVADTEFRCAPAILDALHNRVAHGVLGYTLPAQYEPGKQAIAHWLANRHQWHIALDWILWTPGVVPAFNVACKAFCEPGDKVLVQVPNYPPLLAAPGLNSLERVDIPTVEQHGRWMLDWDALETAAADPKAKLLILCNPMNPVGSVLSENELLRLADICERHDLILCSDEIHCDLILDDKAKHVPAGKLDALRERSLTLMAASKTFNIAGLGASFAVIENAVLRRRFSQAAMGIVPWVNVLGLVATEAAFTRCDEWYQAQLQYLRDNRDYLVDEINKVPGLSLLKPQATYLAWVDASGLGVENPQHWFENKGVGPSPGADFGDPQFVRINFGCPRRHLEEAIQRINA